MANPFKEAEKAKKKAPGSKHEPEHTVEVKEEKIVPVEEPVKQEAPEVQPEVKVEPVVAEVPEVKPEPVPEEKAEKKPAKATKSAADIFAKLGNEKPSGKTYAFYLSDDNVDKLKKMAEKKKISASKLLDHILSEVL